MGSSSAAKQRFGLPAGFMPNFQRYGRLVLLEDNIYRLPDGTEFVPCRPLGMLAAGRHLYGLLTVAQHEHGRRGSIFIRLDGRIFDYSSGVSNPDMELFDTGYTIQDLERTGRYVSTHTPAVTNRKIGKAARKRTVRVAKPQSRQAIQNNDQIND
jgi:hypothetical protein